MEIKFKSNKGKTYKSRLKTENISDTLQGDTRDFAQKTLHRHSEIEVNAILPNVWTNFSRITLANRHINERLTIDLNLCFKHHHSGQIVDSAQHLVIAELKRERSATPSPFVHIARDLGISPTNFSKYCTAMMLLNPQLKQNQFKKRVRSLNKMTIGA